MKTFRDVYTLPLRVDNTGWIYDRNNYFVAQMPDQFKKHWHRIINIINGISPTYDLEFRHENGYICDNFERKVILIRGWGNLTGTGGLNLSHEEACNIQATFAEFIVEQLNKCNNDKN